MQQWQQITWGTLLESEAMGSQAWVSLHSNAVPEQGALQKLSWPRPPSFIFLFSDSSEAGSCLSSY